MRLLDVFALAWVAEPEISPDGTRVAYLRRGFDVQTDKRTADLWLYDAGAETHRPLVAGPASVGSLRWSPDGGRLAYVSDAEGGSELFVYYLDTRAPVRLTRVSGSITNPVWSPDGLQIAFNAPVAYTPPSSVVRLPPKPAGAQWNDPPRYEERLQFRSDGRGDVPFTRRQVFTVNAEGGAARQVTRAEYDILVSDWPEPARHADSTSPALLHPYLLATANPHNAREEQPANADIARVDLASGALTFIVATAGPEREAVASPSGTHIAYLSSVDTRRGYENAVLRVCRPDGSEDRALTGDLDRSVSRFAWGGSGLVIQYDDDGDTKLASLSLAGGMTALTLRVGGLSVGRPYAGGDFSVSRDAAAVAFTSVTDTSLAELGFLRDGERSVITDLGGGLAARADLRSVRELRVPSEPGPEDIQAWVVTPPGYEDDPNRRYPLILEIHGGPYTNYGPRFSPEVQLYAAAGYVVVYANPRGSTSYGERFANLIEDDYPGYDYNDLMAVVDATLASERIDEERLYVTGGSGGGVLTAWIVGKTDRFRAAVVAKPVINWASFVLYADNTPFFSRYWFRDAPWEDPMAYWRRSPLSLVGRVKTPTMLLTGESDYRTPIAESEQYFSALRLRGVETAMVRIPGAGHGIAARPSNLVAKVSAVLGWFERYGGPAVDPLLE